MATKLTVGVRFKDRVYGDVIEVVAVGPETHTIELKSIGSDPEGSDPVGSQKIVPNEAWETDFLPSVASGEFEVIE